MTEERPSANLRDNGEIRAGNLSVQLAANEHEIEAAQALRYRIFYEEMGGHPTIETRASRRDADRFDAYCDHLLVIDHDLPKGSNRVVGTYRMLRSGAARKVGRFYSESEFNIDAIKNAPCEKLEVGRSCVEMSYRSRAVIQLLWRGIGAYVMRHDIKLIFGCASFFGIDVEEHRTALSYLHHYHLAPPETRMIALPEQYVEMNLAEKDTINPKEAWNALPPLIKGYLRVGGHIGHGAVIDRLCRTIDVGVIVNTDRVTDKYVQRYGSADKAGE